jgi:hypothetical protein
VITAVQWADPGVGGYVAGAALVGVGVGLGWVLRWSARRAEGEAAAEVGVAPAPVCRVEAVTAIIPRAWDEPDATAVLPRIREVRHG